MLLALFSRDRSSLELLIARLTQTVIIANYSLFSRRRWQDCDKDTSKNYGGSIKEDCSFSRTRC